MLNIYFKLVLVLQLSVANLSWSRGHGVFKLLLPLTPFADLNNQKHTTTREKEKQAQNQTVIKIPHGAQPKPRSDESSGSARESRGVGVGVGAVIRRSRALSHRRRRPPDSCGIGGTSRRGAAAACPEPSPRAPNVGRASRGKVPVLASGGWCELLGTVAQLLAFPRGMDFTLFLCVSQSLNSAHGFACRDDM
jgi:hypothetical protein